MGYALRKYAEQQLQLELFGSYYDGNTLVKSAEGGILSSLKDIITSEVKKFVDSENKLGKIADFFVSGALWKFSPALSIIFTAAEMLFGFDLSNVFKSIFDEIAGFLKDKSATLSDSVLDNITSSAVENGIKKNKSIVDSSLDVISNIYNTIKGYVTQKSAYEETRDQLLIIRYAKKNDLKRCIAAGIGSTGMMGLLKRIIKYVVGVAIAAIGIKATTSAITAVTGIGKKDDQSSSILSSLPMPKAHKLLPDKSVFNSFDIDHINDGVYNFWAEPNKLGSIKKQLIDWTTSLYPELKGHEDLFDSSTDFQKILQLFLTNNKDSNYIIAMPKPFTSLYQLISSFVGDVAAKLNSNNLLTTTPQPPKQ